MSTYLISPEDFLSSELDAAQSEVIECDLRSDPRLRQLSYSSLLTFHSCPRKFQLDKLSAAGAEGDLSSKLTFAFGHIVGEGIQQAMQDIPEDTIVFNLFLMWECDLLDENPKQNKSFWKAIFAVQQFLSMRAAGFLADYELYYHEGKPAVELSFRITLPEGYMYRGFVDVVLRHRVTGEVVVLELKTTSSSYVSGAEYKNSAQAIGYSIVLDAMFPSLSAYSVIYLIFKTKAEEYHEPLKFNKSYFQRALWLQQLLFDTRHISEYAEAEIFPMRGESCNNYFRECKYFTVCELSTQNITKRLTSQWFAQFEEETYDVEVTFEQLVQAQIDRSITQEQE